MHSVREFVEVAFKTQGINITWKGKGLEEKGFDNKTGKLWVSVNEKFYRPNEVHKLCGDYSKALHTLGWHPETDFNELINIMINETEVN